MMDQPRWKRQRRWAVGAAILALAGLSCSFLIDSLDCQTNRDCYTKAPKTVCRHDGNSAVGTCVRLMSPECDRVVGNWEDDEALVLGSVLPIGTDGGQSIQDAIDMVINFEMPNGIPGVPGSNKWRPLAFVECDDANDAGQGLLAATHLAEIGVPAIIGAESSDVTRSIAKNVTIGREILLISPAATSPSITDLGDDRLVWRTAPSDAFQAQVMARYVQDVVEPQVRASRGSMDAGVNIKVMLVYEKTEYGAAFSNALTEALRFNGNTRAADQLNTFFFTHSYDIGETSVVGEDVRRRDPEIVLLVGADERAADVLVWVEVGHDWTKDQIRPLWVLGDGAKTAKLLAIEKKDEVRRRVTGTAPGSRTSNFAAFASAYGQRYSQDPSGLDLFGPAGAYDATFLLALSAVSLDSTSTPITGPNLALGLGAVTDRNQAEAVNIPTDDLSGKLFQPLGDGRHIRLEGASGRLAFDAAGDTRSDILVWCLPWENGRTGMAKYSGLSYAEKDGRFVGSDGGSGGKDGGYDGPLDPTLCNY